MQDSYRVTWTVEVEGDNPLDAASHAFEAMRSEDTSHLIVVHALGGVTHKIVLNVLDA